MAEQFVLYAEDDENDAFLIRHAFRQSSGVNALTIVSDGQQAIDFLESALANGDEIPSIILLDLKMPGKSGFDVLSWVRSNAALRALPVIVLTSSSHDSDIRRSYELGATAYLVKPSNPEEIRRLTSSVRSFWLQFNKVPQRASATD